MASRTAKFAKKCATEGHVKSIEHVKRIEEDALGTTIAGHAQTTRRYNGDLCVGVLTKTLIYQFWGDAVENLVRYAMDIHRAKGFFSIGKKSLPMKRSTNWESSAIQEVANTIIAYMCHSLICLTARRLPLKSSFRSQARQTRVGGR